MFVFKVFTLCALTYITCSEQTGNGSVDQNTLNVSLLNYPATLPVQVLKQLVDISDKSKGLHLLWKNVRYLTKDSLLEDKVRITSTHECI